MKVSFVTTVFNEGKTIKLLLKSLFSQTKFPNEIIIVDGGSTDNTISEISNFKFPESNKNAKIKLIFKKGNRAVGRNEAIKNAKNEIVACSDAGCILDKNWIKEIIKPFSKSKADVVSGYYEGLAKNNFEKCIIPYFLVMPDRVDSDKFLPATRSIAFKKSVWRKAKGFDTKYSYNEDYVFAKKLKQIKAKIVFNKNAIAYWLPKKNLKEAWMAFYHFAFGDAQAGILRPKVVFIFLRYLLGIYLLILFLVTKIPFFLNLLLILTAGYIVWSIAKNFKYVNDPKALYYLPIIQVASDIAIATGTSIGMFY